MQLDPYTYTSIDKSGIGLGAGLLQVRDGMNCWHDETPDNAILCLTAFARKSLPSVE